MFQLQVIIYNLLFILIYFSYILIYKMSTINISDFLGDKYKPINNNSSRYVVPCDSKIIDDQNENNTMDIKFEEIIDNSGNCYFDLIMDKNKDIYKDSTDPNKYIISCNSTINITKPSIMEVIPRSNLCSLTTFEFSSPSPQINKSNDFNPANYTFRKNVFLKCPLNYTGFNQIDKYSSNKDDFIRVCLKNCNDGSPFSINPNDKPRCAYESSGSFEIE